METPKTPSFAPNGFGKRMKSMLKVDLRRAFVSPLFYITAGIALIVPILILVMTSLMDGMTTVDQATGKPVTIEGFRNVWQIIGTISGAEQSTAGAEQSGAGMELTSICNVNLTYFMAAVFVCLFVAEDFRSGYAKNLFATRAKKTDYVVSKTLVGFLGGAVMLLAFFVGALLGGAIASLPFDTGLANAGNVVCCMLSKIALMAVFVSISVVFSVVGKQKSWLSLLLSLGAGMLLFMMIPMLTPLNATGINVALCLAGGAAFGFGLGAVSNLVLQKTALV